MSNNLQFNKTFDPVPESVYKKAHNVAVKAFEALGVEHDRAESAAVDCFKGARCGAMRPIVLDDEQVDVRLVFIDVDVSDIVNRPEKVNIVTVDGREYEKIVEKSIFVCITKTDAFVVECICDNYSEFGVNPDEFSENIKYMRIQFDDIPNVIETPSHRIDALKR